MNYLVSGGSGSLGTAIFQYFQKNPPDRVVCFSRDWQKQEKLRNTLKNPKWARYIIGDVADKERLSDALKNIDIVIHAGAIKDIVSSEYTPEEALKTNIYGTYNIVRAAINNNVDKVLLISTDKACNAINCYGKSKAMAESLAVGLNSHARHTRTKISVCRYGNVVASSGSVVPLFQKQAKAGVLTLTDKRMTRFMVEMNTATDFIFQCVKKMTGGEIFIPKLKSARIVDIAKAIAPDCEMREIGIRPGEKIHEMLITTQEARHTKEYKDYYVIEPEHDFWSRPTVANRNMKEGWFYSSDRNDEWLSVDEIKGMVGESKGCKCDK